MHHGRADPHARVVPCLPVPAVVCLAASGHRCWLHNRRTIDTSALILCGANVRCARQKHPASVTFNRAVIALGSDFGSQDALPADKVPLTITMTQSSGDPVKMFPGMTGGMQRVCERAGVTRGAAG